MPHNTEQLRIVFWGTYDTGKPRVRIMLRGLEETKAEIIFCHKDVWGGVEDKSGVTAWRNRIGLFLRWLLSYPMLAIRYLKLPKHEIVLVGYMGHLDVLVLWPLAKWRGVPVIWDAFVSLYNTVVEDRRLISPGNPLAFFLFGWDWLACRAASLIVLDTKAHARYFEQRFGLQAHRTADLLVGAETDIFHPGLKDQEEARRNKDTLSVLFYGQFIPLHGIETIIGAARRLNRESFEWWLVGKGQEAAKICELLERHRLPNVTWTPWIPYTDLPRWIRRADVCLGIFGPTQKAEMVIPNKVFQILAVGKPLITRDSAAVRELLTPDMPGVYLVPAADPEALADAIMRCKDEADLLFSAPLHRELTDRIEPAAIGHRLFELAQQTLQLGTHESH